MTSKAIRRAVGVALIGACATAGQASAANQTVTIRFAAVAGSERVACGQPIPGLGTTNATAELQDLRFYVSNVKLVRADGKLVPLNLIRNNRYNLTAKGARVTMLDFENGTGRCAEDGDRMTNTVVRGVVRKGTYVGVQFRLGVPAVLNHTDPTATPAPLNLVAMGWSWQSGRKFTKIEFADPAGAYGQGWRDKLFAVHLGSTACVGNPAAGETAKCATPNRGAVTFKRFDFAKKMIALDLNRLVSGADITVNQKGAAGCMSGPTDPECSPVFANLGIGWSADGSGSGLPTGTQRIFRIIRQ